MGKQQQQGATIGGVTYTAEQIAQALAFQKAEQVKAASKALAKSVGIEDVTLMADGDNLVSFAMSGTLLRNPTEGASKQNPGAVRKSLTGGGSALVGHVVVDGQVYTLTLRCLDYMGKAAPSEVLATL